MNIKKFKIGNLHGVFNYDIQFRDNTLILVGENGSCKTTLMKMLFYTLSTQWLKLLEYEFESVTLLINDSNITVAREDLKILNDELSEHHWFRRRTRRVPGSPNEKDPFFRQKLLIPSNIPFVDILSEWDTFFSSETKRRAKKLHSQMESLTTALDGIHIMYLPTYRRIETELNSILDSKNIERNDWREPEIQNSQKNPNANYTELVEFGMNDVVQARDRSLSKLKDYFRDSLNKLTLGYLGDIVSHAYQNPDIKALKEIKTEQITNVIERVDADILSDESKKNVIQMLERIQNNEEQTEEEKLEKEVIVHYFMKLWEAHKELEKQEVQISNFAELCNKYLKNKNTRYTSTEFKFMMTSKISTQIIELDQLSSGEKQIVSLFSHLYLDNKKQYFLLIDEPELSLSVQWQREFLPDIKNGDYYAGLFAVTHSPFIFDNDLQPYACGINEFVTITNQPSE